MKILLLGKNGQVGWELQRTLAPLGKVIACGRQELDLADFAALQETLRSVQPQLIVNAAAYTAVDKAETETDLAMAINGTAPGVLAEAALQCGASLIHYSTDYVFDGTKTSPYSEEDRPNPINVYGKTKLAGERAIQQIGIPHLILRTSWVYGLRGKNFLLTILRLAREREELKIVDDQIGAPTWSRMIAEATAQIVARCSAAGANPDLQEVTGVYHLTAAGETSWYGFAQAILNHPALLNTYASTFKAQSLKLLPISTTNYPTPAQRPAYSVLNNARVHRLFNVQLPTWDTGLRYLKP